MATPTVSLVDWLERDGAALVAEFDRLYVPKNDPRWLQRNALIALGNGGEASDAEAIARYAESDDEILSETAEWALAQIAERAGVSLRSVFQHFESLETLFAAAAFAWFASRLR